MHDLNIINNIITHANIKPTDQVIEIGPGLGALTTHIIPITKKLDVIELDTDVIPILKQKCSTLGELNITNNDILKVDFRKFNMGNKIKIIGNLPYNISSPILFHLVKFCDIFKDMHFMLQKEVVDRITAMPNNKTYGRLSIMLQYHFECYSLFDVPPRSFTPAPKVESSILRLIPYAIKPHIANEYSNFAEIVKQTFQQRRKTLRNTIKKYLTEPQDIERCPVDLSLRPENLSPGDFVNLSNYITGLK